MRVPLSWLNDYCRPELDTVGLADRLDMTGTKVERIDHHGVDALDAFVVGRVLEVSPHPDADRLSVCRVDVGDGEPAQIVCGAPNVASGQTVAVARPGAVMPDGTRLGAAKLRGVESQGMILAEDELAIGTEHTGILVLDGDDDGDGDGLAPGAPLGDVLPIATDVLELEITPNRPDCLGVYGVAREAHAATGAALEPAPWHNDPGSGGAVAGADVKVHVPELCSRFTGRLFEDVRIGPSPPWLKARLTAAGQRPISNVVDITNYVMLLTGQPIHAFDWDRVAGGRLVVRRAKDAEEVETLDGVRRRLDSDVVVIDDADGPTSIAGVMGGVRSEVSGTTTRVLIEAATWNGPNIKRTSTRLGLRSEASARFEKQLQPEQAMEAQAVATALMVELCGARPVPGTVDVGGPGPAPRKLHLRVTRVARLLGEEIPGARCAEILRSLGFDAAEAGDGIDAAVPHWRRADVTREIDLLEEVARIDGMDRLPRTLTSRPDGGGSLSPTQRVRRRVEDALAGAGLLEVQGWSFQAPGVADQLRLPEHDRRRRTVRLRNPLSEDQSELRTVLLSSLLDTAAHNTARGAADLALFEAGSVYVDDGGGPLPDERRHLGALLTGEPFGRTWRSRGPKADVFSAKSVLATVLDTVRLPWEVEASSEPFLHPGHSGAVVVEGERLGWVGEVHPLVAREWDVPAAAAFELDLDRVAEVAAARTTVYRDFTTFPVGRQDLAVVVPEQVTAAQVMRVVRDSGGELLSRASVFDHYRGEQIGEGRVSVAVALEFRAPDRTLTDEEVNERRAAISAALASELGAELRG